MSMDRQGKGARRLEASFFRTDGAVRTIMVDTGLPVNLELRLIDRLFRERLGGTERSARSPASGSISFACPEPHRNRGWQQQRDLDANVHDNDELAALIDPHRRAHTAANVWSCTCRRHPYSGARE